MCRYQINPKVVVVNIHLMRAPTSAAYYPVDRAVDRSFK
jgi:hypothetical protein